MIADENVYDYDDSFAEITDENFDEFINTPIWQLLIKQGEIEKNRPKTLISNPIKCRQAFMVYSKMRQLLNRNRGEYIVDISIDEVSKKDIYITCIVLQFDVDSIEYRDIIDNVDNISHCPSDDGRINIMFSIKDVFIEVKQEE